MMETVISRRTVFTGFFTGTGSQGCGRELFWEACGMSAWAPCGKRRATDRQKAVSPTVNVRFLDIARILLGEYVRIVPFHPHRRQLEITRKPEMGRISVFHQVPFVMKTT